jgi:hypothetical protein
MGKISDSGRGGGAEYATTALFLSRKNAFANHLIVGTDPIQVRFLEATGQEG